MFQRTIASCLLNMPIWFIFTIKCFYIIKKTYKKNKRGVDILIYIIISEDSLSCTPSITALVFSKFSYIT